MSAMPLDDISVERRHLLFVGGETAPRPASEFATMILSAGEIRRAWGILGIRDEATRQRLQKSISEAIEEQRPSVVVVGSPYESRSIVTVRPAREAGWAALSMEPLNGGAMQLDWRRLQEVFDLSRSEADVALALLGGASLVEIARRRGVQHETVRGQVKTLLRKVGVSSQKQLTATLTQVDALLDGAMGRRPAN